MNEPTNNSFQFEINLEETENRIVSRVISELKAEIKNLLSDYMNTVDDGVLWTPTQVSKALTASKPTIIQWGKDGILNPIFYGTRPRYRKSEVLRLGKYGRTINKSKNRKENG